jgi:PAT family beta-lactamase induction signal transducer AmpG
MRPDPGHGDGRAGALGLGLGASVLILGLAAALAAAVGWLLLSAAVSMGMSGQSNVTPYVLVLCMLPFLLMAAALPSIRKLPPTAWARRSAAVGPYVDFFWRYGRLALALMAFVSIYRMGDVLALNLSKPMIKELGYSLTEIGRADSYVALIASITGVGLGGWMAARWPQPLTLAIGACFAALGNFAFVWLAHQPVSELSLYLATGADQFGNGMAGTVFVVYLSLLVNPRFAGAQYAFLSGFAFLLPRLLSGAGGAMVESFDRAGYRGWDLFFLLSGLLSLAALLLLPLVGRARARPAEDP